MGRSVGDILLFSLFVLSLDKYIWSSHKLVCYHVVYLVIDCDRKGGEPYIFALVVTNLAVVGYLSELVEGV